MVLSFIISDEKNTAFIGGPDCLGDEPFCYISKWTILLSKVDNEKKKYQKLHV